MSFVCFAATIFSIIAITECEVLAHRIKANTIHNCNLDEINKILKWAVNVIFMSFFCLLPFALKIHAWHFRGNKLKYGFRYRKLCARYWNSDSKNRPYFSSINLDR